MAAALRLLGLLATLHKAGARGYRGVIATAEQIADKISKATGQPTSLSTVRNSVRILEATGLIDRWLSRQGPPVELDDGRIVPRMVLALTLTPDAMRLWGTPVAGSPFTKFNTQRSDKDPAFGGNQTRATGARLKGVDVTARDRASVLRRGVIGGLDYISGAQQLSSPASNAADAQTTEPPTSTIGLNKRFAFGEEGKGTQGRPRENSTNALERVIGGKPKPSDPKTPQNEARCIAYDLETELIRRNAPLETRKLVLWRLTRELAPDWTGRKSQDWTAWLSSWSALRYDDRRRIISRAILPSLAASLRRRELVDIPMADNAVPLTASARSPGVARLSGAGLLRMMTGTEREPGPRAFTEPPTTVVRGTVSTPRESRPPPGELDPWFAAFAQRMGVKLE